MSTLIIIPARLGSTRLPNKILANINGKTMIQRVYDQANKVSDSQVFVACGDSEIAEEVIKFGGDCKMTDPELPSGTDRIYSALLQINQNDKFDYVVNLQGDVPNIDPNVIIQTINVLKLNPEADIATAVIEFEDEKKADDPNVVKAIIDNQASSLASFECYDFLRSKPKSLDGKFYEHIGIYVYRKSALIKFVELSQTEREINNKLEQLRALDNKMRIFACLLDDKQKPVNVDTQSSLDLARKLISD